MSDINIAVLRHGLSKINELKQLLSIADQLGVGIDGFIYNAYEKPSSYYGYYGLYGIMLINIMQKNICMNLMNMTKRINLFHCIVLQQF